MFDFFKPVLLLTLSFQLKILVNATANSVCNDAGYALLRPCAMGCIGCYAVPDQVAIHIGCGDTPPNECYCRTDLINLATSAISACVSRSCSKGGWEGDYTSAVRFYTSYCQRAGFTAAVDGPARVVATSTGDPVAVVDASSTSFRTTTTRSQATVEITPTLSNLATGEAKGRSEGGGGMSLSDKIALGVGVGIGLPATIAALTTCVFIIRAKRS